MSEQDKFYLGYFIFCVAVICIPYVIKLIKWVKKWGQQKKSSLYSG
jgi:hypothetical protein